MNFRRGRVARGGGPAGRARGGGGVEMICAMVVAVQQIENIRREAPGFTEFVTRIPIQQDGFIGFGRARQGIRLRGPK